MSLMYRYCCNHEIRMYALCVLFIINTSTPSLFFVYAMYWRALRVVFAYHVDAVSKALEYLANGFHANTIIIRRTSIVLNASSLTGRKQYNVCTIVFAVRAAAALGRNDDGDDDDGRVTGTERKVSRVEHGEQQREEQPAKNQPVGVLHTF